MAQQLPSDPVEALHGLYPSVDQELLQSVLAATGKDLATAEAVLREMLGLPAAPSSFSIMRPQSGRPLTARTRKLMAQSKTESEPTSASGQTEASDGTESPRQGSGGKIRVASPMVAGVAVTRPTQSALWKRRQMEEDEKKGKRFSEAEEEGLHGSKDILADGRRADPIIMGDRKTAKGGLADDDDDRLAEKMAREEFEKSLRESSHIGGERDSFTAALTRRLQEDDNADYARQLAIEQEFGKEADPVALAKTLDKHFKNGGGDEGSRSWPESASENASDDEKDSQDADEDDDGDGEADDDDEERTKLNNDGSKPQDSRNQQTYPAPPQQTLRRSSGNLSTVLKAPADDVAGSRDLGPRKQQNISGRRSPSPSTPPGNIDAEVRELFRYIALYQPQEVPLETSLRVFLPDAFIPAIGDPDPFVMIPPVKELPFRLGLHVLDEPCGMQSDPSVVDLALRRSSKEVKAASSGGGLVRSVQLPTDSRAVDAWIRSVKDMHSNAASQSSDLQPPGGDWDNLMQEWPQGFEQLLPKVNLDISALDIGLDTCAKLALALLDIPVQKAKGGPSAKDASAGKEQTGTDCIKGLHVMFQLYSEFKASQHFAKLQ